MHKILVFLTSVFFVAPAVAASLINDTETERVIGRLVEPLARAANIPQDRMKIHIVDDDDFNAFVMGGEDIFVYTGLLKQIKTPNALQAVVAHELGHTLGGHMAQMSDRMAAEMKRTMLIQALGIGLMVAGGNPSLGAGVLAGSSGVAQQSMLAFTRDEERIADNMGVDLMVRANQNPNGFISVFEQMRELTGAMESRINPNRVNHPLTTERLNNVRERIAQINENKNWDKTDNHEYELVQAKLIGYLDEAKQVREKYPARDKSDAAIYARAIANMRGGNLDGARVGTMTLISRNPDNPYFYELLGDIEYQFGHYDDSVVAYEKSLELAGNAPQIQTALALVLTERKKTGDNTRAIELCKRATLAEPAPLAYWVLARAYGDTDPGRNAWALAEFNNMIGKKDVAKTYARRAQKNLDKDDAEYIKSGDILK
ncbi:MAG: M48 family metalloprotease [Alphaproteobacteria bacterium]|nr:M48 family metalloprotease [Alphaproteobacteria bacterium]